MRPDQETTSNMYHRIAVTLTPSLLLCLLVYLCWPYYRFYVDPDAISYLNIVEKYAQGDFAHAINAFWSPMGCWGSALLVRYAGLPPFTAAIFFNTLPAAGMVFASQLLFLQLRSSRLEHWCFGLMSAGFWAYTVYFQSFTDIWQFFFLTLGLLLLLSAGFTRRPLRWVLLGLCGALAYFGKAYSFYFFPIMILIISIIKLRQESRTFSLARLVLICGISIGVMMLALFPWVYLLHEKYGIWTSSTAGKLNMSWWLVGTQEFRPDIHIVVPPPYPGSLYYFEDPYIAQGPVAHFWDSPRMLAKQTARTAYNFIGWVSSANRISPFYFPLWLLCILLLLRKRPAIDLRSVPGMLAVLFLVFPLPYWLLTFDGGRYLWFTIPLGCILALLLADRFIFPRLGFRGRRIFILLFFASFLVTPFQDMKGMFKKGFAEEAMARKLGALGIRGAFVSNRSYADDGHALIRLAWFARSPWYCHTLSKFTMAEIIRDARRYQVPYFFYRYDGAGDDYQYKDAQGLPQPDLSRGLIPGLKVFRIDGR